MQDRFLKGALVGVCAGLIMLLVSLILSWLNLSDIQVLQIGAHIFVSSIEGAQLLGILLGLCVHTAFGALFGIAFQMVLWGFGKDHLFMKSIVFSIFVWLFAGVISNILNLINHPSPNVKSALSWLLSHLFYGLGLSVITLWLDRRAAAAHAGE